MKLCTYIQGQKFNVFVGGCVERGEGSSFRAKAHAHNDKTDSMFGWVCIRSLRRCGIIVMQQGGNYDGEIIKPSMLILHEIAHILTPNHWHDDIWRKKLHQIGGRLNWWEKKKGRVGYFSQGGKS